MVTTLCHNLSKFTQRKNECEFRKIVACEKSNELVCYTPTKHFIDTYRDSKYVLDKCKWCLSWIWSDNSLDRIGPASVVATWEGCGGGLGGGRESTLARSRTPHPLAVLCHHPYELSVIATQQVYRSKHNFLI